MKKIRVVLLLILLSTNFICSVYPQDVTANAEDEDAAAAMMDVEVWEDAVEAAPGQGRADVEEEETEDPDTYYEDRASEMRLYGAVRPFDEIFKMVRTDRDGAAMTELTDYHGNAAHLVELDMAMSADDEKRVGYVPLGSQGRANLDGVDDITFEGGNSSVPTPMTGNEETANESARHKRALQRRPRKWPGGVVYYSFARGFKQTRKFRSAFAAAVAEFSRYTCIKLRRRRRRRNYIVIASRGGCYSYVGMTGGPQKMSLDPGCFHKGVILHEFIHALGFLHEQSRPDRDRFVEILLRNVRPKNRHNFRKTSSSTWQNIGSPYDYYSIMHYGSKAFSIGRRTTIRTRDVSKQNVIGRQRRISFEDMFQINKAYRCGAKCKGSCSSRAFMATNCRCYCKGSSNRQPRKLCGGRVVTGGSAGCGGTRRGYIVRGNNLPNTPMRTSWRSCKRHCSKNRRCKCATHNGKHCWLKTRCRFHSNRRWVSCFKKSNTEVAEEEEADYGDKQPPSIEYAVSENENTYVAEMQEYEEDEKPEEAEPAESFIPLRPAEVNVETPFGNEFDYTEFTGVGKGTAGEVIQPLFEESENHDEFAHNEESEYYNYDE